MDDLVQFPKNVSRDFPEKNINYINMKYTRNQDNNILIIFPIVPDSQFP